MKKIALIGSTGSIGRQAVEVALRYPDRFRIVALAANTDARRLAEQAARLQPRLAILRREGASAEVPAGWSLPLCETEFQEKCHLF